MDRGCAAEVAGGIRAIKEVVRVGLNQVLTGGDAYKNG